MNRLACWLGLLWLISGGMAQGLTYQYVAKIGSENQLTQLFYEGKEMVAVRYYDNGNVIKEEGQVPDGIHIGQLNGRIIEESTYANGKRNGKTVKYHDNNAIKSTSFYVGDQLEGVMTQYDANGGKLSDVTYQNGVEHGTYSAYFPTGAISRRGTLQKGALEGAYTTYYESGVTKNHRMYQRNQLDGPNEQYNPQGLLIQRALYQQGQLHGLLQQFNDKGLPVIDALFESGNMIQRWVYQPPGQLHLMESLQNNRRQGRTVQYRENGDMEWEGYYADGLKEGIETHYFNDGNPAQVIRYTKGKKDGTALYFSDKTGYLEMEVGWQDDKKRMVTRYLENGTKGITQLIPPY